MFSWRHDALEALRIRALALRVLAEPHASPPPELWNEATHCAPGSWRVFLTAERCAIRLEKLLRATGQRGRLPGAVESVLHQRARNELARVLSARTQLTRIGKMAGPLGMRPVVLKGGCSTHGDDPLDLSDLDGLLPSDHATSLAAALDARGHEATFSTPQHLRARLTPQALPVEIHVTLDPHGAPAEEWLWHGITPIPTNPGLWRLSPVEHLWHVLRHATVDHPSRRGRLRDLLLIADAASACAQDELAEVTTRINRHEYAAPLGDVLTMALDLSKGCLVVDRFRPVAITHYLVRGLTRRLGMSPARSRDVAESTFALVLGARERRALWRQRVLQTTQDRSPYRVIAAVEARFPRLGRAWRVSVRSAYRTGVLVTALPIAVMARYLSHRTSAAHHPEGGSAQGEGRMP